MRNKSCTIRTLPPDLWTKAASKATEINPANAPSVNALKMAFPGADIDAQRIALLTAKYWGASGVSLTVGFLDTPPPLLRARILFHMNAWGSYCNVRFSETAFDPQVRIARTPGSGYWSYLGTDILQIPGSQPTMNLDSFTLDTGDSDLRQVIQHETGHTLGFSHEHLRSDIVNRIDPEKAFAYFAATSGWNKQMVVEQVLTPLDNSALLTSSEVDQRSIMCYWLPGAIMRDGISVEGGTEIDAQDAQFASTVYPGPLTPTSIWPNGKIYFFKGPKYVSYDVTADRVADGYPLEISGRWPGFTVSFAAGVDASVVWPGGKVYFFKGAQFIRYDIAADGVDPGYPLPIAEHWPGLWTDDIDAAVLWPNGKAYFFKGQEYIRYDPATNRADPGYPRPIQGSWSGFPNTFAAGVDAAVVWNNGKAYFFKGDQYIRYDISADEVDRGYPLPIAGRWPGLWEQDIDA